MFSYQSGKTNQSAPEFRKPAFETIEERKGKNRKKQIRIKYDKNVKKKSRP